MYHALSPAPHKQGGLAKQLPLVIVAAIAVLAGIWFANSQLSPQEKQEQDLQALQAKLQNAIALPADFKTVPPFNLIDKNGEPATQAALDGRWTLLFFGFTQCPDVCPTTLSVLRQTLKNIEEQHADLPQPEVAFVSIDPNRDKPENLKPYIDFFNPKIHAFTANDINDMYALTKPLNVVVVYTADEENPEQYTVDHTASIFLVDPKRRLRGRFSAPHKAEQLAADYTTLISALQSE